MRLGPKIRVYFSPTSLSNLFRTVGPLLPWSQNVFRLLQLVFRPLQIVFRRFGYPLPSTSSFYFFAIAASWIGAIVSPMIDRRKIYCFPPMITTMIFFSPATAANMVFLPFSPFQSRDLQYFPVHFSNELFPFKTVFLFHERVSSAVLMFENVFLSSIRCCLHHTTKCASANEIAQSEFFHFCFRFFFVFVPNPGRKSPSVVLLL